MHLPAPIDLALILTLGAGLGFFGGLFGIGGGIIAIPVLVLGFGMEQPMAQGTALVTMVPNLLIGWWRYSCHHQPGLRNSLVIGLSATLTTWLVAHAATQLPPHTLRIAFSVFLAALAVRMLMHQRVAGRVQAEAPLPAHALPLVGIAGGSSMGLLGIGGGLVATPLLTGWLAQRQTVAQSLSLALVAPSSVVALGTYAEAQRVDWPLGLALALGGLFTVSAGVALAHRLPERQLRHAFAWMMLTTAVWLIHGLIPS